MRRTLAAVGAAAMTLAGTVFLACGTPEPTAQSVELPAPGKQTLATFEATFDVAQQTATFTIHKTGELTTQTVPLPWVTTGDAGAYLHTRVATFMDGGTGPLGMTVGISAENLWGSPITNFTAYVDAITGTGVGLCDTNQTDGGGVVVPGACATGNTQSLWTCKNSVANKTTPGIPPCSLDYGTVGHTGKAPAAGQTAGDKGVPLPWYFVETSTLTNFHIAGHVEGDAVPAN